MADLADGKRYRLPNGQLVVARETPEGFLLEFRRKYAAPVVVDRLGILTLNGEAMRLTVDCLTPVYTEDEGASNMEMSAIVQMVLDIHERGGKSWEDLVASVKRLHGQSFDSSSEEGS
ncbi:MAG: hypothetical protein GX422_15585 [Deltaproteobacteria bacterium]|jgi:hypothetical protein|nr:hypothetical protein [Deltaproteobacteria bacterium]